MKRSTFLQSLIGLPFVRFFMGKEVSGKNRVGCEISIGTDGKVRYPGIKYVSGSLARTPEIDSIEINNLQIQEW